MKTHGLTDEVRLAVRVTEELRRAVKRHATRSMHSARGSNQDRPPRLPPSFFVFFVSSYSAKARAHAVVTPTGKVDKNRPAAALMMAALFAYATDAAAQAKEGTFKGTYTAFGTSEATEIAPARH
jgi:hypothetical protein